MNYTCSIPKRIPVWYYSFVVTLALGLALESGVNPARTDNKELGGEKSGSIQNYSGQEGASVDSVEENNETNFNGNSNTQLDRHLEQKQKRKPSEDCQAKQAEILHRLQDQFKTSKESNSDSSPKNYHYLMPRRSENVTRFSLQQLEKFTYYDNEHVPRCTPSGKYAPIQCHKIGYCWCVNKYGQAIKNSASEVNNEPNCDPSLYESEDLESFVVTEAKSSRLKALLGGVNSTGLGGGFLETVPYIGDELNTSPNAPTQEDDFNRRVQASQEPSLALVPNECTLSRDNARVRASRHSDKEGIWIPECDPENPNLYAQKQCHKSKVCWCVEQVTGLPLRTNEQLSVKLNLNCTDIRSRNNEDTFNTLRHNRQRVSASSASYYQGFGDSCDAYQRADFVRGILNQFRQQIAEHLKINPVPGHPMTVNPYSLTDSNISTWKFHLIDTDHNGTLNDREWSRFRNNFKLIDKMDEFQSPRLYSGSRVSALKILRQQRRCWRAFLNYCSGGDILVNSISLKEWMNCTDLPTKDMKGLSYDMALLSAFAHTKEAAITRSKSRNPFSSLLKPD